MAKKRDQEDKEKERKHSFYVEVMKEAEGLELKKAAGIDGLEGEIALLRLRLRQLLENSPERVDLQMKTVNTLARVIRTQYRTTPEEDTSLKEAIGNVLKEVAVPLGIKFIP